MTEEIVFYTNPMSRGRIVRWMLEEVGQPYRTELLEYGPPMKAAAYRAINPMGKVPAIRHGDKIVTEAAAICAYLADAFPQAGLAPPTSDRADYYRWLFFTAGPVEQAFINKACGVTLAPEREAMVGYGNLDLMVGTLETLLSGRDYVAGTNFTAADLYLGAQLGFAIQFGNLTGYPAIERYAERTAARPAAIRAREIDDALMAERKAAAA